MRVARDRTPQPPGRTPKLRPDPSGEPGRQYDHLSVAGDGPGQTPLEDLVPGIVLVVLSALMIPLILLVAIIPVGVVAVFVPLGVVFLVLGVWLIRRGARRQAWRNGRSLWPALAAAAAAA